MPSLAERVAAREVPAATLAIYWLCQAGFIFKSHSGMTVLIDPYLSDVVERVVGFKRMMSCPITAEEIQADLLVCTHEHLDHLDTDALPALARNSKMHFAGPIECVKEFSKAGISKERTHLLEEGKSTTVGSVKLSGVYADHGELAPDALGVVLNFDGIKLYHSGDTAYRPDEFQPAARMRPDILIPCINGVFGNMDANEAAMMTELIAPEVVIPSHFWMFVEQNGNPGEFLDRCKQLAPRTRSVHLKPGEEFLFKKAM